MRMTFSGKTYLAFDKNNYRTFGVECQEDFLDFFWSVNWGWRREGVPKVSGVGGVAAGGDLYSRSTITCYRSHEELDCFSCCLAPLGIARALTEGKACMAFCF